MIRIIKFKNNDLDPSSGKQFEFNPTIMREFFGFSESEVTVKFNCFDQTSAERQNVHSTLRVSPSRGDYKIYRNDDDSPNLKDFFIHTLGLTKESNINDYYALKKKSEDEYDVFYIPKDMIAEELIKIIGNDNINVKAQKEQRERDSVQDITQKIFYGAPGTGKSHKVKSLVGEDISNHVRTTFHPDTDYSTFVGAYKPTMKKVPRYNPNSGAEMGTEEKITYSFVAQSFLKAYVEAWRLMAEDSENTKPYYLVIEEINRGNCAQIFGDLFQLLDRDDKGFSCYGIVPDSDIQNFLKENMAEGLPDVKNDDGEVVAKGDDIKSGAIMILPKNLYILATMNTSDQSLFPIDSAFKRRWDWEYVPIERGIEKDGSQMEWKITADGKEYDWWTFLEKINAIIGELTSSEDKKLGFFFAKAKDEKISADTFVSKVAFYLWNDVFKDYGFDSDIFKNGDSDITFPMFFQEVEKGRKVNEKLVAKFIENIIGEQPQISEAQADGEMTKEPSNTEE